MVGAQETATRGGGLKHIDRTRELILPHEMRRWKEKRKQRVARQRGSRLAACSSC
jgi:hypothetical protein